MIWELIVLAHLTAKEGMLVKPQHYLPWDKIGEGDSQPDLIAIDPKRLGLIYVIEVSTAWNLKNSVRDSRIGKRVGMVLLTSSRFGGIPDHSSLNR